MDHAYTHLLDVGESIVPRIGLSSVSSLTSANLYLHYFTAEKTEYVNNVTMYTGLSGSSGITLAQIGLYSIDHSKNAPGNFAFFFTPYPGDLHLVCSTANDTALFSAANTKYTKALNKTFYKERGLRYVLGLLIVGSTLPILIGPGITNLALGQILANDPTLAKVVVSQTSLLGYLPLFDKSYGNFGNTTNGSNNVTLTLPFGSGPTSGFSPDDVGQTITGTNIPAGTTITTWNSFTSVTLSVAATGTGSGITFTRLAAPYSTTVVPKMFYAELTP